MLRSIAISATKLENTNQPTAENNSKRWLNNTTGGEGSNPKPQMNSDIWWLPSLTHPNQEDSSRALCPRAWGYDLIRSRLLSLHVPGLQNRTEQLTHVSHLQTLVGQQFLLSICKFGAVAAQALWGLTRPLLTCSLWGLFPTPNPDSGVSGNLTGGIQMLWRCDT